MDFSLGMDDIGQSVVLLVHHGVAPEFTLAFKEAELDTFW